MSSKKLGSLIVTNSSGDVSGIFTNTDALNALVEVLRGEILESDL
jgi:predicted transcriptional regulator